jgi:predicted alpha/beta superfamily hydrolase
MLAKRTFLLTCCLLAGLAVAVKGQTIVNHQVVTGKTDSVNSAILHEKRTVWIYLPGDYAASKNRYPVIYLLDAEWNFAAFTGMVHELSEVIGNTVYPECIVVAIPNTDRTHDLTPTHALIGPDGKHTDGMETSGGGENFTVFIQKELMPHIDSAYRTAPYKLLVGHSFGGLTAMNIFINHTEMFNSYLVIDPSMWWDSRKLLGQTRDALLQRRFDGKSLFLGIANTMPFGMDTARVRHDTSGTTGHIQSILALKDALQAGKANGLNWSYKYYSTDSHGSVPLIAEYDGLHFLFNFYNFPPGFTGSVMDKNAKVDVAEMVTSHYEDVSKHLGYTILPPEELLNETAYYLMSSGMPDRALALLSLNIKDYPQSANALDSMGDYYAAQKDNTKAAEYYKKSLAVKENPDTRKKLDALSGKK